MVFIAPNFIKKLLIGLCIIASGWLMIKVMIHIAFICLAKRKFLCILIEFLNYEVTMWG